MKSFMQSTFRSSVTTRLSVTAAVALMAVWATATTAAADEIITRDPNTNRVRSIRASEITSESWAEVKYRTRPKGAEESVPARLVERIERKDSADSQRLQNGISELRRGNYDEALEQLRRVHGGGIYKDPDSGDEKFSSFSAGDPPGKKARPAWESEYAHYYYVRALYEKAKQNDDLDLFQKVLMCLDDMPIPDAEKGVTTGGFLERFKDGASRFYPHAMHVKALTLVGLKKYDEAREAFDALYSAAIQVPLHPRWAYEAKVGLGTIEEAKGDKNKASSAYNAAATVMRTRLENEALPYFQKEYGRFFSLARSRMAIIRMADAEKANNAAGYQSLRTFLMGNSPEALREEFGSKLKKESLAALVAGARDPRVQSIVLNGIGRAFLEEGQFAEAIIRFRAVTVKYLLGDPDQSGRACYYLAQAAEKAAAAAKDAGVRKMYEGLKASATRLLSERFGKTSWASK